jgi:surface antigen
VKTTTTKKETIMTTEMREEPTRAACQAALRKLDKATSGNMILWRDAENISVLQQMARANPYKSLDALAEQNIAGWEIL